MQRENSAVIQLEPSIDLKIISSFRKSKDAKTDMIHLGLIFMGKNFKDIIIEIPLDFAAKLKSLRAIRDESAATPAKQSKDVSMQDSCRRPYGKS